MELDRIFKLVDAGFTKEEIIKLAGAEKEEKPEDTPAAAPEEKKPEETPEKSIDDIEGIIEKKFNEALAPFEALYQKASKMVGMPSLQEVEPKGIDDIVDGFFGKEEK